ncbi:MAG: hypothetical protein IPK13_16970 [Deltaproteobacteria bacterium]|nr:hypothetical protein [Deltaproteobacteria bacterium]
MRTNHLTSTLGKTSSSRRIARLRVQSSEATLKATDGAHLRRHLEQDMLTPHLAQALGLPQEDYIQRLIATVTTIEDLARDSL